MTTPKRKRAPSVLWTEAQREHPSDPEARRARFHELMVAEGHIVGEDHPDAGGLPRGWPGGSA